jgi:hypothetical protein
MGNKAGYAQAVLAAMGLRSGQGAEGYLWCEPDDGCRALLQAYGQPEVLAEAAEVIRGWADEAPRELWERLRAEGPVRGADGREVARWVLTQGWGVTGYWCGPDRAGPCGSHPEGWVGSITRAGLATRLASLPALPPTVVGADAREVEPPRLDGVYVYIDPPYVNTTGYGADLSRAEVVAMARRWSEAGAVVAISEQEPVVGWADDLWPVDITETRKGQKRTFSKQQREYLTLNRPPVQAPAEQLGLFAAK